MICTRDRHPGPGLTLPDPAEPLIRRPGRRLMLAVAPRAPPALLVPLGPAAPADHGDSWDQAALARRIRRRRSEERSSSFRPPQVPYFSGRLIA